MSSIDQKSETIESVPEIPFEDFFSKVKKEYEKQRLAFHQTQYEELKATGRLDEIPVIWTKIEEHHIYDDLTGVFTQIGLLQKLDVDEFPKIEKGEIKSYFAVFFDVDGLKTINDSHGHDVGNAAIEAVASSMRRNIRPGDLVGRWTRGDEFLIISPDSGEEEIKEMIRRIGQNIQEKGLTISAGYAKGISRADFLETVKKADAEMYQVKDAKKNV
jgi:diguanylate cyclase (GGDEF)-like protein